MKTTCLFFAAAGLSLITLAETPPAGTPSWTGHWSFDGTLADDSGNGQDAYTAQPVFVPSPDGQALRFANVAVDIPDAPGLRLSPGFRMACRVRFESLPAGNAWATVAMKGEYSSGEYLLRVNPASEGRTFAFFVNTGTWESRVQSRQPVRTNVWYQVAAGWDPKGLWLSVDGDTTRIARTGVPSMTREPLHLGSFEGDLDELQIASLDGGRTSTAYWLFNGDTRDASGHGHDAAAKNPAFAPVCGGQALQAGSCSLSVASTPALQLAPGLRLDCSVFFNELPAAGATFLLKDGEYQLRLDPQTEGGHFAFFVNLNGWEPRVRSECRAATGVWYRVSASWDALSLTLDVSGEHAEIKRLGMAHPGNKPLIFGRFNGLLDNVRIENPKPSVVRLKNVSTESTLLRAGQAERLSGTLHNFGNAVTGCVVTLELPQGVVCETPARLDLGTLPPGAELPVEWRIRADTEQSATATFALALPGAASVRSHKTLAVLPATDPDYSARTWSPPVMTNGPAATYFIDALNGDNARAGTSPETAWRDFTPVNGRTLGPGERLLIRRGSVINQELQLAAHGTAQAWAELGTYGEGARPVIRRNRDIDDRCVLIKNPDYLCIRSLTFCYAGKGLIVHYAESGHRGLLIEDCIAHHIEGLYRFNAHGIPEWRDRSGAPGDGGSAGGIVASGSVGEDIVFRDCEMFQCSSGFRFTGKNVFIDRVFCHDNYTHNTSPHPFLTSVSRAYLLNSIFDASGWHAYAGTMGIMLGGQYGLIIRNCHFLEQPDSGSHDEGGIDFEAGGEGCLVDRCTFRNNAGAAIEMLGLKSPQTRNVEIARSRFDRNNVARKLGPSEIFIWGGSKDPEVCCSTGLIRDNGYVLEPGVLFFTNQAPTLTRWTLTNNTEYATAKALDKALPYDNPPTVDAGREIWTDRAAVRLAGKVSDDGKPKSGRLATAWELLDGPGAVTFRNAAKPATQADFAAPGDYALRLKADDGELWRSALTAVHVLPPGTTVEKAWAFATPLDKEGWTDWNLGTTDEKFIAQKWSCIARPVHLVAGGEYIVALKDAPGAHLLSPDALGVDLDANGIVTIRLQNHTPATRMRLRFTTADVAAWESDQGQYFDVVANDNGPRSYTVDMRKAPGWTGKLKQLRLDFASGTPLTGTCRIDYLWIGRNAAGSETSLFRLPWFR
jgi:hypothetical protein